MRMRSLLAQTLRNVPAEAEVVSHQLLMRAGYIRRLAGGLYNYLPLMMRVLHKVETIVREEMDRTGAQELLMPILQPAEIWQESGRWDVYGKELVRLKDRHERDCVLAPTHEEVITGIARSELQSYRQLPVNLYQIQNKYRDEIRPRFGLLRAREFIMKDAYSFHTSQSCLEKEYDVMAQAYRRIFDRCGLATKMVRSDSGAIGGSVSHEFMVLTTQLDGEAESGENDVFYCDASGYAANGDRAESIIPPTNVVGPETECRIIPTPNATTIEALDTQHGFAPTLILKSILYIANETTPILALMRGDYEVQETKLLNALNGNATPETMVFELRMATDEEVRAHTGSSKGFVGPLNLPQPLRVLADASVREIQNFYVAHNVPQEHTVGANWADKGGTVPTPTAWADIRQVKVGDLCPLSDPASGNHLSMTRGIEVGNIFQLGTKYSEAMSARYMDEDGQEKPFIMGCYGIGVTRTAAAAVERFHDANGIIWPMAIAPFQAVVAVANVSDATQMTLGEALYKQLREAGVDVVIDDRDERAGVKFKDADLMGFPIRIVVGKKAPEGVVELKTRDGALSEDVAQAEVLGKVQHLLATWEPNIGLQDIKTCAVV